MIETSITPDQKINSGATFNHVMLEAKSAMIFAAQHEGSGLREAGHQELRDRILEVVHNSENQIQVRVDSTNLSLDQKIFIERALLRHFDAQQLSNIQIYFRRKTSTSTPQALVGAAPLAASQPRNSQPRKREIPGVKHVIVVASGKGGVGKSTVATNIAAGLAASGATRVGLMDCDIYGPSSQVMLGVHGQMEVKNNKLVPLEGHSVKVVSFGFLTDVKTPVIWRGPMVAKAIEQLCYDVQWEPLDILVLDLPPGTGDVQMTLADSLPIDAAVIVTTPQDIALIDAHKAVSLFEKLNVKILGVVENMAYHKCEACGHQDHIFGSDALQDFLKQRSLTLLSSIALTTEIREHSDRGTPVVLTPSKNAEPYKILCREILQSFDLDRKSQLS